MASIFENMQSKDIVKYIGYINKTIGEKFFDLFELTPDEFMVDITDYDKQLSIPLGRPLDRFDYEFLYQLQLNIGMDLREATEEDIRMGKPDLQDHEVDWVREERQWVTVRSRGVVESYLDGFGFESYTEHLYNYDEIQPWDWDDIDSEVVDSEVTDWRFEF